MENIVGKKQRQFWMGLSIIWVFLYHIAIFSPEWGGQFLFNKIFGTGYIGVDIFLFLSAYGLSFSLSHNTLSVYYKRRISRIYPLYLIFLIFFFVLMLLIGEKSIAYDWKSFLFQMTGMSSFKFADCNWEWYTPSLILLYISFPFLFNIVKRMSRNLLQQIILLVACLFMSSVLDYIIINNLTTRLCIIVMGVLTYFNLEYNGLKELKIIYGIGLLMTFVLKSEMICYSLCVPALLMLLSNINLDENSKFYKVVSYTGRYTFEIYLAQVLTTKYFLTSSIISNVYLMLFITLILTIVLTLIFYYVTKCLKVELKFK